MAEFDAHPLLVSDTVSVWDVVCRGECQHRSPEECAAATHLAFPYRGVYMRHVGREAAVAEANQVVFFNEGEPYQVSHPVAGGDSCLSIGVSAEVLHELTPTDYLRKTGPTAFNRARLRIDARTQALTALLRHGLDRGAIETLEAETLTLTLVRRALGERTSHAATGANGRQKRVDRAKLILSSDLGRRWTLAEIGAEVGVSPVYLTQVFQQVESLPLYRYQLQLQLARALDLLGECEDLTGLALDLGFSSHSHFSAAFKKGFGRTPLEFQRDARRRDPGVEAAGGSSTARGCSSPKSAPRRSTPNCATTCSPPDVSVTTGASPRGADAGPNLLKVKRTPARCGGEIRAGAGVHPTKIASLAVALANLTSRRGAHVWIIVAPRADRRFGCVVHGAVRVRR